MNEKQLEQFITMQNDIKHIRESMEQFHTSQKEELADINKKLDNFIVAADKKYVFQMEFEPIKRVVYGVVTVVLVAVVTAVLALVIIK